MNTRKSYFVFVLAVAALGCNDQVPNPNMEFPPIAKSEPLPPPTPPTPTTAAQSKSEPGAVDPDAPQEFTTTGSGLKYRIRRKSDGKMPTAADRVEVNYKGWLDDGSVFDSSYERGKSIGFSLGGVIKGWTEGLQLVGEGGMIELEIPYQLGYGEQGSPPKIPGKSTLHFIVELIKVN